MIINNFNIKRMAVLKPETDAPWVIAQSTIPTGNVPRVQNLVFPVTIGLDATTLLVEGRSMPVATGMGVTVEMKTG